LIVPGTTIGVMLLPSYVEVRDKGIVKKKIRIHGKSFDYVLEELKLFFRAAGKILRPGLLEEVLIKIGLPKADIILPSGQTPPPKEEKKSVPTIPEAPSLEEKKPSIRISISGADDVVASSKTHVTIPNHIEIVEEETLDIDVGVVESEEYEGEEEAIEPETVSTDAELEEQSTAKLETFTADAILEETPAQETDSQVSTNHVITEVEETSDTAVIRSIIDAKGLILGEDIVGRSTLLSTAGFEPVRSDEDLDEIPYHFKRILNLKDHRVCLDVWHFDEAVKAGIQRKEFYESPDVVLVVYSVVDRWSFESLTYWLKEIAVTNEILPPIVIIGNKSDLRSDIDDDSGEPSVTQKEGFDYAEELATTLARNGNLHPVAFIETSCETQEKVLDAFTIAAELFIKHQE
jgi:GTPase SAR1 family protein